MVNKFCKKRTILFLGDLYDPSKKGILDKNNYYNYNVCNGDIETVVNKEDINAIIVKSPKVLRRSSISMFPNLLVISTTGKGFDNIDVEYATEKGILVLNNPMIAAIAVVEHVFSMIFGLLKKINFYHNKVLDNDYHVRDKVHSVQLRGKNLGIIGYGKIGKKVSLIAHNAFNMKVNVFDPFYQSQESDDYVSFVDLDDVLRNSDIISLHAELNKSTYMMIDKYELSIMKTGSYLINTARGGLINMDALKEALINRHICAAALDVFEPEPPRSSFFKNISDYVLLSPHVAGLTDVTISELSQNVINNILMALDKGVYNNALNPGVKKMYLDRRYRILQIK